MDKVWIVTKGEFSDYYIEGVFSSEEAAQRYKEAAQRYKEEIGIIGYDWSRVVEWNVDEKAQYAAKTVWQAQISIATGKITNFKPTLCLCPITARGWAGAQYDEGMTPSAFLNLTHLCYSSTISKDHAIKGAIELRQKALALRA